MAFIPRQSTEPSQYKLSRRTARNRRKNLIKHRCGLTEGTLSGDNETSLTLRSVSALSPPRNFDDQQQLSDLITVIYDAAIDPSLWLEAIISATAFVGGS